MELNINSVDEDKEDIFNCVIYVSTVVLLPNKQMIS